MTKQLIATLVAAIILFVWQFLSWGASSIHRDEYGYTANQEKIMEALNQNLTETGIYFLPGLPPGASAEAQKVHMENTVGKPWATVSYHQAFNSNMGMNLFRGFVLDLFSAFLLVWLLMKFANLTFLNVLQTSVAVGLIGYMTFPYLHSVWFETNSTGYLIDGIVPWAVVGAWLGWWLRR